jgi:predicted transcriptional regulator
MPHPRPHTLLAAHLRHPPASPTTPPPPIVLLSIKPHYADLIARGEKRAEFRRRFPKNFTAGRATFYVTAPTQSITLIARIGEVRRATPATLWREFHQTGGTPKAAFDAYFTNATSGVALILETVETLAKPIPLTDPRLTAIDFRPPQSLTVLPHDSPLAQLITRAPTRRSVDPHLFT